MAMTACGLQSDDIAYIMRCTPYEIEMHYRQELENGLRMVSAEVGAALLKNARNGDVTAQSFWLKNRAGWSPPTKVEVTGRDGGAIQVEERKKTIDTVIDLLNKAIDPRKNDPVEVKAKAK
jgi:hypothetical protein